MVAILGLQKELAEKNDEDDIYDGKTKNPHFFKKEKYIF